MVGGLEMGPGWLQDVAKQPDRETNGWVYLHYGDRRKKPLLPVSKNELDRARIKEGNWVVVQTICKADLDTYTSMPELGAGGRIAFHDQDHVFIRVGM